MAKDDYEIVYESVTIHVPKAIMDFLRAHEKILGSTPERYIEYSLVDQVRADIDNGEVFRPYSEEIVKQWNLDIVFKEVLNAPFPDADFTS